MKKHYEKPSILFEDFTASTNIAAGCEEIIDGHSRGTCAYTVEDEFFGPSSIFTSQYSICTTKEDDGEYNGFCYHIPIDTKTLFNS